MQPEGIQRRVGRVPLFHNLTRIVIPQKTVGYCTIDPCSLLTFETLRSHLGNMIAFNQNLFVRVQEVEGNRAPSPRPLESGFSSERLYRVLGIYTPSETAEAYFILPNDQDEIWFISQRHLRFAVIMDTPAHHLPLNWPKMMRETSGQPMLDQA